MEKFNLKTFVSILALIVLIGLAGALYEGQQNIQMSGIEGSIPVQKKFENKIVYTTNLNKDAAKLKKDCEGRGGEFHSCGNICKPDAKVCSEVCAYTCDLNNADIQGKKTDKQKEKAENQKEKIEKKQNTDTEADTDIEIDRPVSRTEVDSPLVIEGRARRNWFFEGTFNARLENANSKKIGGTQVKVQGEWTTNKFTPFEAKMEFEEPNTQQGVLFLEKANPSRQPENAEMRAIPIEFKN